MKNQASPLKIFLLGYGGANNTGAEIRMISIVQDIQAIFGEQALITIGTLDKHKTLKIIQEHQNLRVLEIPYIFPFAIWRITKQQDLVVLVEGSTFKDNWSSALLYLFLWGAWTAKKHGNKAVAYAVDAGRMSWLNRKLTTFVCDKMDLIITRTQAAKENLQAIGVSCPIEVTTDSAFQYHTEKNKVTNALTVGLAPVEFYQWPVRFQLWGLKKNLYHWPYYFSWNKERSDKSEGMIEIWVTLIKKIILEKQWQVTLIAMEELDKKICEKILNKLPENFHAHIKCVFSGSLSPKEIVVELRHLDYLVTSRYHAGVLSMGGYVPQMAIYHDERLISLYEEMHLESYAIHYDEKNAKEKTLNCFELLVSNDSLVKEQIKTKLHHYYLPTAIKNRALLKQWYKSISEQELSYEI